MKCEWLFRIAPINVTQQRWRPLDVTCTVVTITDNKYMYLPNGNRLCSQFTIQVNFCFAHWRLAPTKSKFRKSRREVVTQISETKSDVQVQYVRIVVSFSLSHSLFRTSVVTLQSANHTYLMKLEDSLLCSQHFITENHPKTNLGNRLKSDS